MGAVASSSSFKRERASENGEAAAPWEVRAALRSRESCSEQKETFSCSFGAAKGCQSYWGGSRGG